MEYKVESIDKKISKLTGLEPEVHLFQKIYNPLHFYCRLLDIGIEKKEAKRLSEIYEIGIYHEIMNQLTD
jgi:hypothetical protein